MLAGKENIDPALRRNKAHKEGEESKHGAEKNWCKPEMFRTMQKFKEPPEPELSRQNKLCKSALKVRAKGPATEVPEIIKARKYGRDYFEKQKSKQIGVTTLFKRQTTVINLPEPLDAALQSQYEKQCLDTNEHIPNMDMLLSKIDKNTSLKVKLEKAIIEFNQAPSKGLEFLWKEQIVRAMLSE